MNNEIKELSEKRDAAMVEAYTALFVKDNAAADYREKLKTFNEIDAQLEQAKKEEVKQ